MNDLISRLSEIRSNYNCFDEKEEPYYKALSEAIQLVSARFEQKRGKWKEHKDYPNLAFLCSECGYFTTTCSYYCPNCGTKMRGEDNV